VTGLTAEWTGSNLTEMQLIAPAALRVPGRHSAALIVATGAGERSLPPGSIVYFERGVVRAYSRVVMDCALYDLLTGGT
jgi:hypothetical protein